jgi:hypothetical protein
MFRRTKNKEEKVVTPARKGHTAITLNAEDLASLGRLVGAGQVLLQTSSPVVAKVKAAMTRVGVSVPRGL